MPIIYTISTLLLFVLAILVRKTKEKFEIIKTIILSFILLLSYNAFICYILNLFNIPITLVSLSIINFILDLCFTIKIIKDKEIQKYRIKKENILILAIFIFIAIIILCYWFGNNAKIKYLTGDSIAHYKAAREFSENTALSNKEQENNTTYKGFMILSYSNEGILFKILQPYIGTLNLFNVYIVCEAINYILAGVMFFFLIQDNCKNKLNKIIGIIFSVFYVLGYPLCSWICGFHYLTTGILYVTTIIYAVINIIKKDNIKFYQKIIIMFLLNFGIMFSYCLFCPFIYLAEFIYYCYKYKKDKEKIFLMTLIALVIPGIIGVTYLIIPTSESIEKSIVTEGYVYKNLWSNFIFFIPFAIYKIYNNIKNKEISFDGLMLIILIIFMLVMAIGIKLEKCSEYYFYKNYFILWILLIEIAIKGMLIFMENGKTEKFISELATTLYIVIFILSIYFIITPQTGKPKDNLSQIMHIFTFNNTMMKYAGVELSNDEYNLYLEFEKEINNNWKEYDKDDILFVTNTLQKKWINSLTGYNKNIIQCPNEYKNNEELIQKIQDQNYKYIIIVNKEFLEYANRQELKTIYEGNNGVILENKEK